MDTSVRRLTIAEQAERAARLAADTLVHQPNEYKPGTDDHAAFEAAYARAFHNIVNSEDAEGSA